MSSGHWWPKTTIWRPLWAFFLAGPQIYSEAAKSSSMGQQGAAARPLSASAGPDPGQSTGPPKVQKHVQE